MAGAGWRRSEASVAHSDDSPSHAARKALFARGIRRGWLSLGDIAGALPEGSLTEAERWLLFASLRAARVEVRDGDGRVVDPFARANRAPDAA
jgi:hypothetical protein